MLKHMASVWKIPMPLSWVRPVVVGIIGLLLAQGVLLGELYPFGIAFLGGICLQKPDYFNAALTGVIAGTLFLRSGEKAAAYLASAGIVYLLLHRTGHGQNHPLSAPVFIAAVHGLLRSGYVFWRRQSLYDWISVGFESVFVLLLIFATVKCVKALDEEETRSPTVFISLMLLGMGMLVGLQRLTVAGLSLQSVGCRWLILCAGLLGGPGGGAAAGVAAGMLPLLQGTLPTGSIAFYALAGLLAGVFSGFRKTGACVGLILANLLLSAYFSGPSVIFQALKESLAAIALFYILPVSWMQRLFWGFETDKIPDQEPPSMDKLKKIAAVFEEMETMLAPHALRSQEFAEGFSWDALNAQVAGQVCVGCSLVEICWKKDRKKTVQVLQKACQSADRRKDQVIEKDLELDFVRHCPRSREMAIALTNAWEKWLLVYRYESRLAGSQSLMHRQLSVLGQLMGNLSREMEGFTRFQPKLQKDLYRFLKAADWPVGQVIVADHQNGFREIRLSQVVCISRRRCAEELLPQVANFFGAPFEIWEKHCPMMAGGSCTCTLIPQAMLKVEVGQAQCPKFGESVSGDMVTAMPLPGQKFALVISDGMGAGTQAREESVLALNLLEKLLKSDLSPEISVKIVNTALILGVGKETFATLDLALINRVTGETDFVKAGGAPSMIWDGVSFHLVTAAAPPAGILDQINPEVCRRTLSPGHLVISMSDGVWEAMERLEGPPGWMEELMTTLSGEPPQQIAEYLLYVIRQGGETPADDDLCVQIAKIG
jgi:stage II sporulation protein E